MSDKRLRELEKRWQQSGADEDASPLISERLRSGATQAAAVRWAAAIGFGPAQGLVAKALPEGEPPSSAEAALSACLRGASGAGLSARSLRWLAVAFAERLLPCWTALYPDEQKMPAALEVARQAARGEISADRIAHVAGSVDPSGYSRENTLLYFPGLLGAAVRGDAEKAATSAVAAAAFHDGDHSFLRGEAWQPGSSERAWQARLVGSVLCGLVELPARVQPVEVVEPALERKLHALLTADSGGLGFDVLTAAGLAGHKAAYRLADRYGDRWNSRLHEARALEPGTPTPPHELLEAALGLRSLPGIKRLLRRWSADCVERVLPVLSERDLLDQRLQEALEWVRGASDQDWPAARETARSLVGAVNIGDTRDYYGDDPWRHAVEAIRELSGVDHSSYPATLDSARDNASAVWEGWICWQRAKDGPGLDALVRTSPEVTEQEAAEIMNARRWAQSRTYAEARFERRREKNWQASRLCHYLAAYPNDPPALQLRPFERESLTGPLVRVISGGDEGERWRLDTDRVLDIGRGSKRSAHLQRDPKVSREHAQLRWDGAQWILSNASQSGTRLNGHEVTLPTPISPGARIEIGGSVLTLEVFVAPDLERP